MSDKTNPPIPTYSNPSSPTEQWRRNSKNSTPFSRYGRETLY